LKTVESTRQECDDWLNKQVEVALNEAPTTSITKILCGLVSDVDNRLIMINHCNIITTFYEILTKSEDKNEKESAICGLIHCFRSVASFPSLSKTCAIDVLLSGLLKFISTPIILYRNRNNRIYHADAQYLDLITLLNYNTEKRGFILSLNREQLNLLARVYFNIITSPYRPMQALGYAIVYNFFHYEHPGCFKQVDILATDFLALANNHFTFTSRLSWKQTGFMAHNSYMLLLQLKRWRKFFGRFYLENKKQLNVIKLKDVNTSEFSKFSATRASRWKWIY